MIEPRTFPIKKTPEQKASPAFKHARVSVPWRFMKDAARVPADTLSLLRQEGGLTYRQILCLCRNVSDIDPAVLRMTDMQVVDDLEKRVLAWWAIDSVRQKKRKR